MKLLSGEKAQAELTTEPESRQKLLLCPQLLAGTRNTHSERNVIGAVVNNDLLIIALSSVNLVKVLSKISRHSLFISMHNSLHHSQSVTQEQNIRTVSFPVLLLLQFSVSELGQKNKAKQK